MERNKIPDFIIVFILINFNLIDNADSSTSSE